MDINGYLQPEGEVIVVKNDEVSTTIEYVGESNRSDDGSGSTWRIRKTLVDGFVTTISYANNDTGFNLVWDDRASYTYI